MFPCFRKVLFVLILLASPLLQSRTRLACHACIYCKFSLTPEIKKPNVGNIYRLLGPNAGIVCILGLSLLLTIAVTVTVTLTSTSTYIIT